MLDRAIRIRRKKLVNMGFKDKSGMYETLYAEDKIIAHLRFLEEPTTPNNIAGLEREQ